jgi:hypothetical protein
MGVLIRFDAFSFGSIRIDGIRYEHDVVIDQGKVRKGKKKPSKKFRGVGAYSALSGGRNPLDLQAARHRHRNRRPPGDG